MEGLQISKANNFGTGDIKYTTQGIGVNYLASTNVKFMFYYDMIQNETTAYLVDRKDNLFTARVQYRF